MKYFITVQYHKPEVTTVTDGITRQIKHEVSGEVEAPSLVTALEEFTHVNVPAGHVINYASSFLR